jgi:hypothetical protein
VPKDTGDNAADFDAVNAEPNIFDYGFPLGAPGPENLTSPNQRNSLMPITNLDPAQGPTSPPNRERNSTVVPNGALGTLIIRRKVTNNTGQPVTRVRFRIIELTTRNTKLAPTPGVANPCPAIASPPCADLRAITSPDEAAIGTSLGPVATNGMLLEEPPGQPVGGGYNSSLRFNNITLGSPLAPGATTNVNLRFGVQSEGSYFVLVNVEVLP